ncbi:sugar ABC transporter substrate-binding protein [Acidaminobacter sp. JC074]|uniref:sugar ABC transporter substrate-binding protein n=1 Tax=Acidaminobacter sp. JC074 TaxID=2530199 RepID=UPI001F10B68B|nr:substrate-binding domain-containing protein [Acidaminobacter sp. JC074]MCH4888539.1 sugar ABC transporter substrate-binding protein [Acidaminobacter sp. JC074]
MKTPKYIMILTILSGLLLIGSLGIGLYTANDIKNRSESMNQINNEDIKYHIMMILNEDDETYSESFYAGVETAASTNHISVETILIGEDEYLKEVVDRMDMAMYARVDGIIVHAYNNQDIIDKINQASEMNIPVITLNENLGETKRISFAGNNRYSIGLNVGKTIADITSGRGRIAVINRLDYSFSSGAESLLSLGMNEVFDNYSDLKIGLIRQTEQGVLSAETIATEILDDYPEIDGIYCSDSKSTLGIVQVLIDRNRVNDFTVIGFGDDDEILQYIRSGVIKGTIVTDNEAVGIASIVAFHDYVETGIAKSDFLPSIMMIDQSNLDAYIRELEVDDEN